MITIIQFGSFIHHTHIYIIDLYMLYIEVYVKLYMYIISVQLTILILILKHT